MPDTYMVIDKETGLAVLELFKLSKCFSENLNKDKYEIMTAKQYLPTLNKGK